MADHTQQLIWTTLPNGSTQDGKHLRLSVLVSPRLVTPVVPGEPLKAFPDFLDWATRVTGARLQVRFDGKLVDAAFERTPTQAIQSRIMNAATFVRGHVFEDRHETTVVTAPHVALNGDLAEVYGDMAVRAQDDLPSRLAWFQALEGVVAREPRSTATVLRLLRAGRHERQAGPRQALLATRTGRFDVADAYNTSMSAVTLHHRLKTGPDDPREDVSWQTQETVPLARAGDFHEMIDFHRIVGLLSQHPDLLLATGFRLDLTVPRDAFPRRVEDRLELVVDWPRSGSVETLPDIVPGTMTILDGRTFEPAPSVPDAALSKEGFARLGERSGILQVDVNGSVLKLRQFAINIANTDRRELEIGNQPIDTRDPAGPEPDRAGAPALRSGGLMLADDARGEALELAFDRAAELQARLLTSTPITLFQDDLLRGLRVEISDGAGPWRSLCRRTSTYRFMADQSTLTVADCEGTVRVGASGSADGSQPDLLKVDAGIFRWDGWSLVAPPPGRAIDRNDAVADPESLSPPGLPLEVDHTPTPRSLPSLRFGRSYRVRMRTVDLAGNARAFDEAAAGPAGTETDSAVYHRFEPVEAPAFALVGAPDRPIPTDGESLHVAAIRSLNATPADNVIVTAETAERHVVPPAGSQRLAELHGMLDTAGRLDAASFDMLAARDSELGSLSAASTESRFPVAEIGFELPYLPDPLSRRCVVQISGYGDSTSETLIVPFYSDGAAWPDASPFRIHVSEGQRGSNFDAKARVLHVHLEKAEHVRVRFSHALEVSDLELMGVHQWGLARAGAAQRSVMEKRAAGGRHWMLTPWRDIDLVHAVQKPLVTPAIQALTISRSLGATLAHLGFSTPVDSRSTEKLDLAGRWLDPFDNPDEPAPVWRVGGAQATELKLQRLEAPGTNPPGQRAFEQSEVTHAFADTRYRRVGYTLTATTRFTPFMFAGLRKPDASAELTVSSDEAVGFLPNSTPPPAPDIVYVIPTFGWTRNSDGDTQRSYRDGGGLRIYLRRPWLVSGAMELLGVLLPPADVTAADVDARFDGFVTRWGGDPTLRDSGMSTGTPRRAHFPFAITAGPIVPERLDPLFPKSEGELPGTPFPVANLPLPGTPAGTRVEVAPHLVGFDPERKLWFADIVLDPGLDVMAFIRLALARYQPISAPGAHLSPPAVAEVLQLTNDRLATLTRQSPLRYRLGVFGPAPEAFQSGRLAHGRIPTFPVEVAVEHLGAGNDSDFGWKPLLGARADLLAPVRPPKRAAKRPPADGSARSALAAVAETLRKARDFPKLMADRELLSHLLMPEIATFEITLPRSPEQGERFRLVITEHDLVKGDREEAIGENSIAKGRVIYVETFEIDV